MIGTPPGNDRTWKEVYHAYGYLQKVAARMNIRAGRLPAWKDRLTERVWDEVIGGELATEVALYVFLPPP